MIIVSALSQRKRVERERESLTIIKPKMRFNFHVFLERFKQLSRVIFMEDHIPERSDRTLIIVRQTSIAIWSLWDVVFLENYSSSCLLFWSGQTCNSISISRH